MGIRKKVAEMMASLFSFLFCLRRATFFSCSLNAKTEPLYAVNKIGKRLIFYCPNITTRWRAATVFTKEPETIRWIDKMKHTDTLFDVGANVGVYSIYAGVKGLRVFAFEPESQNFSVLNRNIYVNSLHKNVRAFSIAVSDADVFDRLNIGSFQTGGALNSFGNPIDYNHKEFRPDFEQGTISFTIDSIVANIGIVPTHLKVDVDGLESKIIRGAGKTLKDKRLKSVLVEINESLASELNIVNVLAESGLKLAEKAHAESFESSEFKRLYNYIFEREENA